MEKMYRVRALMDILGISRRAIYQALSDGKLRHYRAGGGKSIVVPESAVKEFLGEPIGRKDT